MAKIELKQPIVDEIAATVKDAATVVIVKYSGITVAQDTQLRKQLREAGVVNFAIIVSLHKIFLYLKYYSVAGASATSTAGSSADASSLFGAGSQASGPPFSQCDCNQQG